MHQRFKDAHYKLQSAKRQFEYIEILERHLYKLNSKDKNIEKDLRFFSFSCRSGLTKTAPLGWDLKMN